MLSEQIVDGLIDCGVAKAAQRREDVLFLVGMVVRQGQVEIAQHVAGGLARRGL